MNKIMPAWLRQNIDKRVVMISGVSITAALVFWGCLAVVKKLRKKKLLELLEQQVKNKNWSDENRKGILEKIEALSSEELKIIIEILEQNKDADLVSEIDKMSKAKQQKNYKLIQKSNV